MSMVSALPRLAASVYAPPSVSMRISLGATLIASQLEPNEWYLRIEGELMADSILGRTGSTARYLDLDWPNMREYFAKKNKRRKPVPTKADSRYRHLLTGGTAKAYYSASEEM